ncbi:glycosyltransferase [Helicobacter cappadocius]|uniref:Glycosyltransferase n=1 Tax=Helicobacter cappadocius TaxID=3063998 RepID=A0AA90PTA9_9HELI|nr:MULTISPECIES: glycosyltransferase [unclassified Helicobacter]MDO7253865.1 glycosyltransferase [Helicobacter sp. faydin-H75]MDP2539817.1 glycosyltransferase [Helicobacter sp. faydin-H76]
MKSLAPVLVMVYDRLDSLQNAIESLKTNELAKYTDLYVVSDAAYKDEHEEIILKIREYIKTIKGFQKVKGICWEKNKGSFDSGKDAIEYIFSRYDRIISIEDDILVSNKFLEYMNNALEYYKDDKRIFSITSHIHHKKNLIPRNYPYEIFPIKMFNPWGTAIWKDRYESIDWSLGGIEEFLKNKQKIAEFNKISPHLFPLLQHMLMHNKKYTDVMICYDMFKNGKYTLYPIKPLSVNRGHDGRGEHCGKDKNWQNQKLEFDFSPKMVENIPYSPIIAKNISRAFFSYRSDLINPILKKLKIYTLLKTIYKFLFESKKG